MELSTQQKGSISEYRIISRLIERGFNVFKSCTEFSRVDIIVEIENKLYKVQCKTGKLKDDVIIAHSKSVNNLTHEAKKYTGQIDYFCVYCFETDGVYVIPEESCGFEIRLRVNSKSNQIAGIKFAKDYQI